VAAQRAALESHRVHRRRVQKGIVLDNQIGTFGSPGGVRHGYETHNLLTEYGCGNVWRDNRSDLGDEGDYAIFVTSTSTCEGNLNVAHSSDTVTGAVKGLTNIKVTP
jgi:hypothetical protein